jgi:radical SAM superfamily enzyme YgiQ (UPF0313 family)
MQGKNIIFLTAVMTPWMERSIGAYQLSSFLRSHGYTTQVIDFIHLFTKDQLLEILEKFTDRTTRVVSISSTFLSSEVIIGAAQKTKIGSVPDILTDCLTEYKALYPNVKIVVGGAKALSYQNLDFVDHIITGYGEVPFLNFLKDGSKQKHINGDLFLDLFDSSKINHKFVDEDFIFPNETLPLEISRGCIFRCKFCAYPLNGKKKLDHIRDVELIKSELINNYEKWKVTNYLISDDTFNDSNEKLQMLHDMIVSLPFKISFVCYLRLDLLYHFRDTQLEMLENMGLKTCHFGVESFNPPTAKFIGKGLSEDKTKDFLLFLKERWQNKISFMCTFISGLPFETKESCIDTGNWCRENDITFWMMPLFINPTHVYKSDIDINYRQYGYELHPDTSWTSKIMTFQEAKQIADSFTTDPRTHRISAWNMFAIMSLNLHNADELYNMTYAELDKNAYQLAGQQRFIQYIEKIKAI